MLLSALLLLGSGQIFAQAEGGQASPVSEPTLFSVLQNSPIISNDDFLTAQFDFTWSCSDTFDYCISGTHSHTISAIVPDTGIVEYISVTSNFGTCTITSSTNFDCVTPQYDGGSQWGGTVTIQYTQNVRQFTFTYINQNGTQFPYIMELQTNCIDINAVEVCADDLTAGGDIYTGTQNISIGNYLTVDGSVAANTANGTITGAGILKYVNNGSVDIWTGQFGFSGSDTSSGNLKLDDSDVGFIPWTLLAGLPWSPDSPSYNIDVNPNSGALTGTMQFPSDEKLDLGVANLEIGTPQLAIANDRGAFELSLRLPSAELSMPANIFDTSTFNNDGSFTFKANDIVIYEDDIVLTSGEVTLPDITVASSFKLTGIKANFEKKGEGYAFSGEGIFYVQNFIKKLNRSGIYLQFTLFKESDVYYLSGLQGGLRGLQIPLGSTGLFLKDVTGGIEAQQSNGGLGGLRLDDFRFSYDAIEFFAEVVVYYLLRFDDETLLNGTGRITVNTDKWASLTGAIGIWDFQVARSELFVNKLGVSDNGVRGTMQVDVVQIIIGEVTIYVTLESVAGSGLVAVQLPEEYQPFWLIPFTYGETITAASAEAYIIGNAQRKGIGTKFEVYPVQASLFIDSNLDVEADLGWAEASSANLIFQNADVTSSGDALVLASKISNFQRHVNTPTIYNANRLDNTTLDGSLPVPSANATDSTLVTLTPNAEQVIFFLDNNSAPNLSLSLIDPNNNVINPSTVDSYQNIVLGIYKGYAYSVETPIAGDWYAVIDGIKGGEIYELQVVVRNEEPAIVLNSVTPNGQAFDISWSASDPENLATVSLYADRDAQGYDGELIASNLALNGTFNWLPKVAGDYNIYAIVDDGSNIPTYSDYSQTITAVDNGNPVAPTNLMSLAGDDEIYVQWDANTEPDVEGYRVVVNYDNMVTQDTFTYENQITVSRPDLSQTVTITVFAVDYNMNESVASALITVAPNTLDDLSPALSPSSLIVYDNFGDVVLNWIDNATNETEIVIERGIDGIWTEIARVVANTTTYTDVTPDCGTTFDYRVSAYRSDNQTYSEYSNLATFITVNCPIAPPDLVSVGLNATDNISTGNTQLNFTIANIGTTDASAFDVDIILSENPLVGDSDDIVIKTIPFDFILAGNEISRSISVDLPIDVIALRSEVILAYPPGLSDVTVTQPQYYLAIEVDTNDDVDESNESNNRNNGEPFDGDDLSFFPWDFDGNGSVELEDVVFVANLMGAVQIGDTILMGDMDLDGIISPSDVIEIINRVGYVVDHNRGE